MILHSLLGWVKRPPGRTVILKTLAWKMAQVKGLISNFFHLVVFFIALPHHPANCGSSWNFYSMGDSA